MADGPGNRPLEGARFALLVAAILCGTSLTYVVHVLRTPDGLRYHGCDYTNLGDLYSHVSWMTQAAQGHILFLNVYDPAPQPRTLFLPYFLLLGWITRLTGADPVLVIHAARVAGSALLLVELRRFVAAELPPGGTRIRAFLLLALGTGLPALLPEASPVSTMFDSELHTAGWLLLVLAARSWLASCRSGRLADAAVTGIAGAVVAFVHPYEAIGIAGLALATSLPGGAGARLPQRLAVALLPTLAASAAVALSVRANPVLESWARHPQPTAAWNLLAFGTLWPLALAGLFAPPRDRRPDLRLVAWLAAGLALMIAPLPAQRRFVVGLQAPLAILGALGFDGLLERGWRRTGAALLCGAFPVAALFVLLDATDLVPSQRYVDAAIVADCRALAQLPAGPLFTSPGLGYFAGAFSGHQVSAGQKDMTSSMPDRISEWERFQAGEIDGAWLAAQGYRYVVVGPTVKDPGWRGLRPHLRLARLRVYEVIAPGAP